MEAYRLVVQEIHRLVLETGKLEGGEDKMLEQEADKDERRKKGRILIQETDKKKEGEEGGKQETDKL